MFRKRHYGDCLCICVPKGVGLDAPWKSVVRTWGLGYHLPNIDCTDCLERCLVPPSVSVVSETDFLVYLARSWLDFKSGLRWVSTWGLWTPTLFDRDSPLCFVLVYRLDYPVSIVWLLFWSGWRRWKLDDGSLPYLQLFWSTQYPRSFEQDFDSFFS